jgi:hypothetical protein
MERVRTCERERGRGMKKGERLKDTLNVEARKKSKQKLLKIKY